MKSDNAIATFWHSYTAAEKAGRLLTGMTESPAPDPMTDAVSADESPGSAMLEVVEYHQ